MSQKDTDDIKKAIAAIDARKNNKKSPNKPFRNKSIKSPIVQGGSTGLRQQSNVRNFSKSKNTSYIFQDIKVTLKEMYKVDIVFIQGGRFFHAIEEDADFVESHLGWRKHDRGGTQPWLACSGMATKRMEEFLIKKMEELSLRYAILRQTDYTKIKVTRTIVAAHPKNLIGMEF
ncbi:hypothetical protein OAT47_00430 [Gammaproteobacteria bacterium]|nr:hypothetical protein [Gammaproteobacteria bacterium]